MDIEIVGYLFEFQAELFMTRSDPGDLRLLRKEDMGELEKSDLCQFNGIHDYFNDGRKINKNRATRVSLTVTVNEDRPVLEY